MTTPAWNVRVTDTALVLEHADASAVTTADADAVYEAVNGFPPPVNPNPEPTPPAGLANGLCLNLDAHDPHRATMPGDDGTPVDFWCMGRKEAAAEAAAEEPAP